MSAQKVFDYGKPQLSLENCSKRKERGVCIENIIFQGCDSSLVTRKYLSKEIDLECLASNSSCSTDEMTAAKVIADGLLSKSVSSLLSILRSVDQKEQIAPDNIPQYGDLSIAMYLVPEILSRSGQIGYIDFGKKLFYRENKSETAYRKYAENHCKLAALLDLAKITKSGNECSIVSSSVMGRYFISLAPEEKDLLLQRLCLRIPIVKKLYWILIGDNQP